MLVEFVKKPPVQVQCLNIICNVHHYDTDDIMELVDSTSRDGPDMPLYICNTM